MGFVSSCRSLVIVSFTLLFLVLNFICPTFQNSLCWIALYLDESVHFVLRMTKKWFKCFFFLSKNCRSNLPSISADYSLFHLLPTQEHIFSCYNLMQDIKKKGTDKTPKERMQSSIADTLRDSSYTSSTGNKRRRLQFNDDDYDIYTQKMK